MKIQIIVVFSFINIYFSDLLILLCRLIHLRSEKELKKNISVNINDEPVDILQSDSSSTPIMTHHTHFHSKARAVEDKKLDANEKVSIGIEDASVDSHYQSQKLFFSRDASEKDRSVIFSLANESECNQESTLFQDSDYESANGAVLTMMREMEVRYQQALAKERLKKKEELGQTHQCKYVSSNQEFVGTKDLKHVTEDTIANSGDLSEQNKEDMPERLVRNISQQNFENTSNFKSSNFISYQARLDGRNTFTSPAFDLTPPEEDQGSQVIEKVGHGADNNEDTFECSIVTKPAENSNDDFVPNRFSRQDRYSTMEYAYEIESSSEENNDFTKGCELDTYFEV